MRGGDYMKYRIICAIDIEIESEEQAKNIISEQLKGKAGLFIDYIEKLEENEAFNCP
jgi:hypothetical protein